MIFQQQRLLANNVLHNMYDARLASPRKSPISFGNVCMRSLDAVGAISSLTEKSSHTIFMNFNYPNIPFFSCKLTDRKFRRLSGEKMPKD